MLFVKELVRNVKTLMMFLREKRDCQDYGHFSVVFSELTSHEITVQEHSACFQKICDFFYLFIFKNVILN